MKLYLVRHAIAEDAREGQPDAQRALTREGIEKFRRAAAGFVKLAGKQGLPLILTSPLVRARQTAELLAEALDNAGIKTRVEPTDALAPGDVRRLVREVRTAGKGPVAAVGHEPFMSSCAGQLCFAKQGAMEFKKGAIAAIELGAGPRGELLCLLPPGVLRKI